ncbi:MAG: hypoxanthine phosphoribosyltransferase [Elusimicrobiota bacterium]|jgi:hypoxanthine phosphoribosyltransferase|nr:hypoxanthine phosphoribosyltransferase [Elusimicrobiota bacterium]
MQTVSAPLKKVLITKDEIAKRAKELGEEISKDYEGKLPLIVCILRGSVLFYSDIVRNIKTPCNLDFMCMASYGAKTHSSGKVRTLLDLREAIEGRHIVLVEDIVDTGLTIKHILDMFRTRKPASVEVCTLLDKPSNRTTDITPKYVGFTVQNEFVVGYGLDYNELYRNLPFIGVFNEDETK